MNIAIIGAGFGDEGKGRVVDWLCKRRPNTMVVRYSGGHQAGHTVRRSATKYHTFSNFGAGSLRDIPTFWSRFCTVHPTGLLNELKKINEEFGIKPKLLIDPRCPITTPFDIHYQQNNVENLKHGSCGVGFGPTIQRQERMYSLTFKDLYYPSVTNSKIYEIIKYYAGLLNISFSELRSTVDKFDKFMNDCDDLVNNHPNICKFNSYIPEHSTMEGYIDKDEDYYKHNMIFEGSQGLLLDKDIGFFPHVTRSNVGTKNIMNLVFDINEIYLVTRAYQTRHGVGPLTNQDLSDHIKDDLLETNVYGEWQGEFRKSMLNIDMLNYAIDSDDIINNNKKKKVKLVITCLDHLKEYKFTHNNKVIHCSSINDFIKEISNRTNIPWIFTSDSFDGELSETYFP